MFINKWGTFTSCILLSIAGGSAYCWSLYSGALKTAFHLNQSQLEEVSNPLLPQFILSWLPGLGVGYLSKYHRTGPRLSLLIGVVLNLFGNGLLWLAAIGWLGSMPLWSIVWLGVIGSNGIWFFDVASMTTVIANFPQHRGTVVGILKASYGISASIFSTIYNQDFDPDGLSFMLFITLNAAVIGLVALPSFNIVPFRQAQESAGHRFLLAYASLAGIALYQPLIALITSVAPNILLTHILITAGLALPIIPILFISWGTGGLLARPIITVPLLSSYMHNPLMPGDPESGPVPSPLPSPAHRGSVYFKAAPPEEADVLHDIDELTHEKVIDASLPVDAEQGVENAGEEEDQMVTSLRCHLVRSDDILVAAQEDREQIEEVLHPGRRKAVASLADAGQGFAESDMAAALQPLLPTADRNEAEAFGMQAEASPSLLSALASINFWLLFVIFGTGTGCGLLLLLNLGQLVESLGGAQDGSATLLSLFAVFNSLGRVIAGWLPEHLLHTRGTPRTLWLIFVAAGSAASTAMAGLAGGMGSLRAAAPLAGVVYGSFEALMPVLASELFDMQRFATLYVALQQASLVGSYILANRLAGALYDQKAMQHLQDPNVCIGADCFRDSFLIAAALQVAATGLAAVLYLRTRTLYRQRALEVHSADLIEEAASEPVSPRPNQV